VLAALSCAVWVAVLCSVAVLGADPATGQPEAKQVQGAMSDAQVLALITSTRAYLNGNPLPLTIAGSGTLAPVVVADGGVVSLPGLGVAFVVAPHTNATACH